MSLKVQFLFLLGVIAKIINAQDCIVAPNCPSVIPWTPGYVCDENRVTNIQKSIINGGVLKTICCAESCNEGSSCPINYDQSSMTNKEPCLVTECENNWNLWTGGLEPLTNGVVFNFGLLPQFIGRVRIFTDYQAGLIDINNGIKVTFGGREIMLKANDTRIEYLLSNSQTYNWVSSHNGSYVEKAVSTSQNSYIGKITVSSNTHVASIQRSMGGLYYKDLNGNINYATNYEVLTCDKKMSQNVAAHACPVEWISSSNFAIPIVNATIPSIFFTPNGAIVGANSNYLWVKLKDSANFIPATFLIPGGFQYNIGRINKTGSMIIGRVDISSGIMEVIDDFGKINRVLCYEVLVCDAQVSTTTIRPTMTSTTTTTLTSTTPNPQRECITTWKTFTSGMNISSRGIKIGTSSMLVGKLSPLRLGNILPEPNIYFSYCLKTGPQTCSKDFDFLESNLLNSYFWVSSQNGIKVDHAVGLPTNPSIQVGFVNINGVFFIGTVVPSQGLYYFETTANVWRMASQYEVLMCIPGISTTTSSPTTTNYITTTSASISTSTTTSSVTTTSSGISSSSWTQFSGSDISQTAILAGYSGGSLIYIGQSNSNTLGKVKSNAGSFCFYYFSTVCNSSFSFLAKGSGEEYSWVPSSNGVSVQGAIPYQSFSICRVTIGIEIFVGQMIANLGCMYFDDISNTWKTVFTYDVIIASRSSSTASQQTTSSSTMTPPTGSCSVSWTQFPGSNVSQSALLAGYSNGSPIYIGQSNSNILGRVKSNCFFYSSSACNSSFSFLEKGSGQTYSWLPSRDGLTVQGAIPFQSFLICRVLIGSETFVGQMISGLGCMYFDDISNTWKTVFAYHVVVCSGGSLTTTTSAPISTSSQQTTASSGISTMTPPGSSSSSWTQFSGSDISQSAILAGYSGGLPVYIGESNSNVLGRVKSNAGSFCFSYSSTVCNSSFSFLMQGSAESYSWVPSRDGVTVQRAILYQSFSICRVTIGSETFIGQMIGGLGCMYLDDNSNTWKAVFTYDVITSRSISTTVSPISTTSQQTTTSSGSSSYSSWTQFSGSNISQSSILAGYSNGSPIYIGQSNSNVLGRVKTNAGSFCFPYSSSVCNSSFSFLMKGSSEAYSWVPSSNGLSVQAAIPFQSFSICRVTIGSETFIGQMINGLGCMYLDDNSNSWKTVFTYDVVIASGSATTTTSTMAPPIGSNSSSWTQFSGSNVSQLAILAGYSNGSPVYIGQSTSNAIGRVKSNAGSYCFAYSSTVCNSSFSFLGKSSSQIYSWASSRDGLEVENAIPFQSFSICRVTVGSETFVGQMIGGLGCMYLDDISNTLKTVFTYDVIVCCGSSAVPTTRPVCSHQLLNYTNTDISQLAVSSGISNSVTTYVGFSNSIVGTVVNQTGRFCYSLSSTDCTTSFLYIPKNGQTYSWTPSRDGLAVANSVSIGTIKIGRVTIGGNIYIGNVVVNLGTVYLNSRENIWGTAFEYDILTCVV